MFGHKPETYGSQGKICGPYHDGIGRAHRDIYAECVRCNRLFRVISVIDPTHQEEMNGGPGYLDLKEVDYSPALHSVLSYIAYGECDEAELPPGLFATVKEKIDKLRGQVKTVDPEETP